MKPGDAVTWVDRRRDGTVNRIVRSHIVALETVRRTDGVSVDCACLACHRFVPVAALLDGGEFDGKSLEKTSPADRLPSDTGSRDGRQKGPSEIASPGVSVRPPVRSPIPNLAVRDSQPAWNDTDKAPPKKDRRNTRTAARSSRPAEVVLNLPPCNVLAVDFLNVLVRAWHSGKPTETHAVRSFFQTLAKAIRATNPAHVVIAMDGGHLRRSQLLPEYKAHRPPSDPNLTAQKELAENALIRAGFDCVRVHDWEADDILASVATQYSDTVIVSSDKDLLAVHGRGRCRIYHPWGNGEFVTPESRLELPAGQVTDFLAICGDTSDGIPGVKGIGPKTALELLQKFDDLETILMKAHVQQIPGSVGKKLRDQRADALLCRQVVELNSTLSVELSPFSPSAGWQQRLTEWKLGSAVAVVESLDGMRFKTSSDSPTVDTNVAPEITPMLNQTVSAVTTKTEPVECDESDNVERSDSAVALVQGGKVNEPGRPVTSNITTSAGFLTRSITEPIRESLSMSERWEGDDGGLFFVWECGRRKSADPSAENPWKRGTDFHIAWKQGFDGVDLALCANETTETPAAVRTAGQLSLF